MARRPCRNHSSAFKAKVALAALRASRQWLSWLSGSMFTPIKLPSGRPNCWSDPPTCLMAHIPGAPVDVKPPRQNRRTDAGKRFFRNTRSPRRIAERKAMIDREHKLPISQQAKVLGISRGTAYYQPKPVSPRVLALMNRIDRLHLELPSPAPECCAICCARRAIRSAVSTSPR